MLSGNQFDTAAAPKSKSSPSGLAEHRPKDERANFVTHVVGFGLSLAATALLMTLVSTKSQAINIVAAGIYCFSLVGLYAASSLSHMFHARQCRQFFRMLDQVFIYLLIAGSFTPFAVFFLWYGWWPALLAAIWALAILGVLNVVRVRDLTVTAKFTYGILGCLPLISLKALYGAAPIGVVVGFVAGVMFYSAGAFFLRLDHKVRYFHAIWHGFVIAGSSCHYFAILLAVI